MIEEADIQAVADTIRSGWLTMGSEVAAFEQEFAQRLGASHAVAVNSCTAALHLGLEAMGLKAGDEVIVPAMTFTATAEVICYFGAKPVFVDIQADTHCMDPELLQAALTSRTRAIMPVHYAGQPADMDEIMAFAHAHDLRVIEDAAHALPARYHGQMIGTIGDITAYSFYATKTLAVGEGGMAVTHNEAWAERMQIMRLHGMSRDAWRRNLRGGSWDYEVLAPGFKYNMTDPAAAMGRVQLQRLDTMAALRRRIDQKYRTLLDPDLLECLEQKSDRESAYHLFVIKLRHGAAAERNKLITDLEEEGIRVSVHFRPLPLHPAYAGLTTSPQSYAVARQVWERMMSLPIWPQMTDEMVERVAHTVNRLAAKV